MKKIALLFILILLMGLFSSSCDKRESEAKEGKNENSVPAIEYAEAEEKNENSIPTTESAQVKEENNLYDPDLIGTWILQEEPEDGKEKPVQAIHFFENGDCYNYYYGEKYYIREYNYETDKYEKLFEYYESDTDITDWYTNKKESLLINNGRIFKYTIENDVLTISNFDGEKQVIIKSSENLIDIISENERWIAEHKEQSRAAYEAYKSN